MKEAIKIAEGKHSATYFLGNIRNELVVAFIQENGGFNIGRYTDEGLHSVELTAEMTQALCYLLGDDRESQTIERLRADHDALNARYHRLLESFGTLQKERDEVQSGFDALWRENETLKKRIRQLEGVCMQAWADINSGHAARSLAALDAMHPYEDDPYGLQRLPQEDTNATLELAAVASEAASDEG